MARAFPGGAATDRIAVAKYAAITDLNDLTVALWVYRTGDGGGESWTICGVSCEFRHNRRRFWQSSQFPCESRRQPGLGLVGGRTAAQFQHPHILPLLDSGEAGGFLYYVMPYVEGESLRTRLARHGELPIHDAVKVLVEVCDALAYAHAHGVVGETHDAKPVRGLAQQGLRGAFAGRPGSGPMALRRSGSR